MNPIFTIVSGILPIAIQELEQFKVISPQVGTLITGIEGAGAAAVQALSSGPSGNVSVTATSLLAAISAAIQVLQTQTGLSPTALAIIAALDSAIAAGLAATNITSVDPTKLQPVTPA